jgi:hypothetical protein
MDRIPINTNNNYQNVLVGTFERSQLSEKYFSKNNIDLIQNSTEANRNKLYDILKELFLVKMVDDEKSYTINPSLTLDKILSLEEQTRIILLDLYISCEKYFIQALIIFENIYESKDYTISEYRKENLMNIQSMPMPPSINYKDSLTITPPFSPDISGQMQPGMYEDKSSQNKSQTSEDKSSQDKSQTSEEMTQNKTENKPPMIAQIIPVIKNCLPIIL